MIRSLVSSSNKSRDRVASRATRTRSPDSNSRNNCYDKGRAAAHCGLAALFIELRSSAPSPTAQTHQEQMADFKAQQQS
jgi:hypothetical protein